MQRQFNKIVSLLLVFTFIMSAVPSYAKDFKDVKSTHWAKPDIDKMSNAGIINGYTDGTFKPENSVTHLEVFSLISGLIKPDYGELVAAETKYKSLLNELSIPWGKEKVAICLNRGVISEGELKNLSKSKILTKPAKRVDVAMYLTKGMGLEEEANEKEKAGSILFFKDYDYIEKSKRKYVCVLNGLSIIQGDNKNKFNPNNNVKRSEMAKMLSKSYDYIIKNPIDVVEQIKKTKPIEYETKKGTIDSILTGSKMPVITILDNYGDRVAYSIRQGETNIYVDGRTSDINGLVVGQEAEVKTIKGDRIIVSINVRSIEEEYTGKIKYLYPSTRKLTLEYEENKKIYTREFEVDKNADIYLDDKAVYLSDLREGDMLKLKAKNNNIYDIDAESKFKKIEGTLEDIRKDKDEYYLTVVDSKDKSHKYPVSSKAYITRNKSKAKIEDLKYRDTIYMEVKYNEIVDIDARVVKRELKGYIVAKNEEWNKDTEITINVLDPKTGEKKEETFILPKDAYIRVDNKENSSYNIKLGYYVEMIVEGIEITEIYADSSSIEITINGKVLDVNYNRDTIVIAPTNIHFYDGVFGDEVVVHVDKDTVIYQLVDKKFYDIYFNDIRRKDMVEVKGSFDGTVFLADEIRLN